LCHAHAGQKASGIEHMNVAAAGSRLPAGQFL